ncbi:MAG: Type IV pilus assembly protein PilM, type IV pilus assembly protein PilM [Candidatus Magasanikbacteria bacterium]|nr:Type IV pilus assembly protein PilM, type IV pilus assembly protein PilM [Candidatus Magasanikbacteria bacterium]
MWPFPSKKSASFLGVDLGAGGIKLVELENVGGKAKLRTYGFTDELTPVRAKFSAGEDPLPVVKEQARRLAIVVKQAKAVSKMAVASLPASMVFSAIITIPKVAKKEFQEVVNREVSKLIPFPLDEAMLDTRQIPLTDGGDKRVAERVEQLLVTATRKNVVQVYSDIFTGAGLTLDSLETESFALIRALVGKDQNAQVIVDIGAERTNFLVVDRGVPRIDRSIELGGRNFDLVLAKALGVSVEEVGPLKIDLAESAQHDPNHAGFFSLLENSVSPILKEIQYAMEVFADQNLVEERRPDRIILTGGSALIPHLAAYIEKTYNLKTVIGDPWTRVTAPAPLKPVLQQIGPRFSVAIGLAMRNVV